MDAVDKDGVELLEKRAGKINYRRLARGLHMLRLGKRGAPTTNYDFSLDDSDTLLPYDNLEEYFNNKYFIGMNYAKKLTLEVENIKKEDIEVIKK